MPLECLGPRAMNQAYHSRKTLKENSGLPLLADISTGTVVDWLAQCKVNSVYIYGKNSKNEQIAARSDFQSRAPLIFGNVELCIKLTAGCYAAYCSLRVLPDVTFTLNQQRYEMGNYPTRAMPPGK